MRSSPLPAGTVHPSEPTQFQNEDLNAAAGAIERLLVVIDADQLEQPVAGNALLERAVWLARLTRASIQLFHVCTDEPPLARWLRNQKAQMERRTAAVDLAATRLAELAVNLTAATGLAVEHDARWASDEAGAIVQKASESRADLIMKSSERSDYLLGLRDRPDWTLIRQSPAHLWFVGDDGRPPRHVLAAIGEQRSGREAGSTRAGDRRLCEFATMLDASPQLKTSVLHTRDRAERIGSQRAVADLIGSFPIDPVTANIIEGTPRDTIPDFAEALDVDVILMGAENLTRLERFLRPAAEEPVLGRTRCDVVFLRPAEAPPPTAAVEQTVQGLPAVDVEKALTDPDIVFDHSPEKLAAEERLSVEMRERLLEVWEQDLKSALVAEDDGAATVSAESQLIPAIVRARSNLGTGNPDSRNG